MKSVFYFIAVCLFSFSVNAQIEFGESPNKVSPELKTLDSLINAEKYDRIKSVLIAQEGKLIFEAYYGEYHMDTKHNARSATKTMATLLAGLAYGQGHIKSEKDLIMAYLNHKRPVKNPDSRKEKITIEDLMTMSSLLECDDQNQFSRGQEERMYLIEDWTQFYIDLPIKAFTFNPKPEELPFGRSFSYASAQAAAMAEVIQSAIGRPLDEYAIEFLLGPLGITDYYFDYTPMNILNTAGGSGYRSRDFLKLIQLIHNNGNWQGKQLIPADWMDKATSPQVNVYEGMDYGYFLWLTKFGLEDQKFKCIAMNGNGGNRMISIPELDATIVVTTTNYNNRNAHDYVDEMLNEYIIPALIKN